MSSPTQRRPRLLVLNQYYWPGVEATANLLTELCEGLASTYDVEILTGVLHEHEHDPRVLERNGVAIRRVRSTAYDRTGLAARAANYFTYIGSALARGLFVKPPDLVLCMTDPPMVGAVGLGVAHRFSVPLVVVCQDVFPETAVQLGRLTNPVAVAVLRKVVSSYLRRADRVVSIGETMSRRLVAKGAPANRVVVIPNWVDFDEITPQPRDNAWAREHELVGHFVVMHSGNVGHAQDLETLVRAAALVQDLERAEIVIVGFGARHRALSELAGELGAANIRFLPYQPREVLSESLSTADVHFVGLARGLAGYVVPSRINGVLSAGRPVIVAADAESETAQLVGAAGCGIVVPPGDAAAVAHAIRCAYKGDLDLGALGSAGRIWIEANRGRDAAIDRYRRLLDELRVAGSGRGE
ncbi:MAG: glycosyltransferase WbuB [Thermoleophilia bacterium]|nr:glycosyltransferase WbuB [Thermoleophilia bacterium]